MTFILRWIFPTYLDQSDTRGGKCNLPSTIGIANLLLGNRMHLEIPLALLPLHCHNGRVGALRDDDRPLALPVLLGQIGQVARDLGDILGAQRMGVGVAPRLGLVPDEKIPIRRRFVKLVLEELRDEGRAEAQHEDAVLGRGLLGERQDGGHANSQMVAADEIDRGLLYERPDFGGLQMLNFVLVGGSKVRAHAAVMASDDDAAAAGGLGRLHAIFDSEAGGGAGGA